MSTVVDTADFFKNRQAETKVYRDALDGSRTLLSQTNEKVQGFLNSSLSSIVVINENDLCLLLRDYFLFSLRRNNYELNECMYVVFVYLEQLILDLMLMRERGKTIVQEPYVMDWLLRENYQTAGDVATFGYLFFHNNRRNELNKEDYLGYMSGCYSIWHTRSVSFNTGRILSGVMPIFLPLVEKLDQDLFRRGIKSV